MDCFDNLNKDIAISLLLIGLTMLMVAALALAFTAASMEAWLPDPPSFVVSLVHNAGSLAKNVALGSIVFGVIGAVLLPAKT